ncbi:MAG: hypothetical protein ACWGMY_08180, partial [Hyphomicrobiaceae bacterium]
MLLETKLQRRDQRHWPANDDDPTPREISRGAFLAIVNVIAVSVPAHDIESKIWIRSAAGAGMVRGADITERIALGAQTAGP